MYFNIYCARGLCVETGSYQYTLSYREISLTHIESADIPTCNLHTCAPHRAQQSPSPTPAFIIQSSDRVRRRLRRRLCPTYVSPRACLPREHKHICATGSAAQTRAPNSSRKGISIDDCAINVHTIIMRNAAAVSVHTYMFDVLTYDFCISYRRSLVHK